MEAFFISFVLYLLDNKKAFEIQRLFVLIILETRIPEYKH